MAAARYIWIDDSLRPASEGVVPFLSAGMQFGFSVFEGIRCYATDQGPAVFRMNEHVQRLFDSAHIVGFRDLPVTSEQVKSAINQTIAANEYSACYIRPMIYLDGAMMMTVESGRPRFVVAVWEWKNFLGTDARERGIRANIASFTRLHPNIMMTKAKVSGNYVSSILAKTESHRAGFDEAIMLGPDGYVAECTGENLFVVRNKTIYTTPRAGILEGITRDSLITLARDLDYTVVEEPISRDQLYIADEVFVCGTAAEVVALREIDFRVIGDGKTGPVTRVMQEEFHKLVSGRHARSVEWFAPVPALNAAAQRLVHVAREGRQQVKKHKHRQETEVVRGGNSLEKKNGPLSTPIYQTSTFEVTDMQEQVRATHTDSFYTRYGNPTHTVAENAIAELEGTDGSAALLVRHGRDHHFFSFAGQGWRPHRGAARHLWRRD